MDYKPLGIDFGAIDGFQSDDGRLLIYAFNIATNSIEKFEYNSGLNVLKFKKTFVSDLMINVNDIHAVGEDLIYFSIGQQFPSGRVLKRCSKAQPIRGTVRPLPSSGTRQSIHF